MHRTRALALLALVALTLASVACSDDDAVDTGSGPSTTGRGSLGSGDPGDVVISIERGGGYVPEGTDFAAVPTLVLRDGTVLTGGAVPAIYPGPPVSPVLTGQLDEDEVAALVAAAADAGLDADELDAGQPGVTDVETTVVTVAFADGTRRHAVYALGFEDDPSLTDEQQDVRRAFGAFVDQVSDAAGTAADQEHEPTGYQVDPFPVDRADLAGSDVVPNELAWPLDAPLVAEGCLDVEGDDVAVLADALADASQITVWTDADGASWQLAIRVTLPNSPRCSG